MYFMDFILALLRQMLSCQRPTDFESFSQQELQRHFRFVALEGFRGQMHIFSLTHHFHGFLSLFYKNQRGVFFCRFLSSTINNRSTSTIKDGQNLMTPTIHGHLSPFRLKNQTNSRQLCLSDESGFSIPAKTAPTPILHPVTQQQPICQPRLSIFIQMRPHQPIFSHFSRLIILNIIIFQMLNEAIYFYNPYQNTLHTPATPWFLLDFTISDFQRALKENLQLKASNGIFSKQLEEERNQRVEGQVKLEDERQCNSEQYQPQKRNYKKRRTELQKIYTCEHQACRKKYSSEMALRNHERIKHAIRRRLRPELK